MLKTLERWFGLYKITANLVMTTYHYPVERKGKLTGAYQHKPTIQNDWVAGKHPSFKEPRHEK